jgi:hypothetical protein
MPDVHGMGAAYPILAAGAVDRKAVVGSQVHHRIYSRAQIEPAGLHSIALDAVLPACRPQWPAWAIRWVVRTTFS